MPTFTDPVREAAEASNALRGLAHATRSFDDPAQTYPVIGDLLAGVRSLRQVVDQLGAAHLSHQHQAADDAGSPEAGAAAVSAADSELRQAAALLDAVEGRLDTAMQHSGRIAWHTDPTVYLTAPATTEPQTLTQDAAASDPVPPRWISVVFLQGEEADEVLDVIWTVQEGFLEAALQAVERDHGGVPSYLERSLGVGDAARRRLADLYLQSPASS